MPRNAQNFVERLEQVRKLLSVHFPKLEIQDLVKKMGQIGHYHYNKKKYMLIGEDRKLYNLLIENSYNPYTVYKWLLLERIPKEIKWQLRERQISQKHAMRLAVGLRRETGSVLAQNIKELGMELLSGM